tara:strand:- start:16 stop:570 length:555 start_codon:yes stop_codon:yes gene_type:complete
MKRLLLLATLIGTASAYADPNCREVSEAIIGVGLGEIVNYPDGLKDGIVREGTAEFIYGLGFESLEGKADYVVYPRIMVFYDRGSFTSLTAVGAIEGEPDRGLSRILENLRSVSQASYQSNEDEGMTFTCEENIELNVEMKGWDDGQQYVAVRLTNKSAMERANEYIKEYCSDPKRRRPQDACN